MNLDHLDKQTADGTAQNLDALYLLSASCLALEAFVPGCSGSRAWLSNASVAHPSVEASYSLTHLLT